MGTVAQQTFGGITDNILQILRQPEVAQNFLALQQQIEKTATVNITVNTNSAIDAKIGRDNKTLQLLPMINSGFSALNDITCGNCTNKNYN